MSTFDIRIETTSAAFDDDASGELDRILRDVADRVSAGHADGVVKDVNGNTVGRYTWTAADPDLCTITGRVDCADRNCELHYMDAPLKLAPVTDGE